MSLFLGPIHYKMYEKATRTCAFASSLALYLETHEQYDAAQERLRLSPQIPQGSLEKILDLNNIHGSLREIVAIAENHLSIVLQLAQKDNLQRAVLAFAKIHGTQSAQGLFAQTIQQVWQLGEDFWVDGMPCDFGVSLKEEDNTFQAHIKREVHPAFTDFYFEVRGTWISAFAQYFSYHVTVKELNTYIFTKEKS